MSSQSNSESTGKDEKYALIAVAIAVICVALGYFYMRRNKNKNTLDDLLSGGSEDDLSLSNKDIDAAFNMDKLVDLDVHPESDYYKKLRAEIKEPNDKLKDIDIIKLRKHLMRRALQWFPSCLEVQTGYSKLEKGYKQGMASEDAFKKMKILKEWVDSEAQEISEEAEVLQKGWGKSIFQEVQQYYFSLVKKVATAPVPAPVPAPAPAASSPSLGSASNGGQVQDNDDDDDDDRADDIIVGERG